VKFPPGATIRNGILLTTVDANTNLGAEGYELAVAPDSVVVRAPTQAGLFYGVQTLLQLLPPEIFSTNLVANVDWQMPCVQIDDWPRFPWRGLMLDVSRHFYNKSEVETLLDAMALHKAREILKSEFPAVAKKIALHVPDEKSRRVGQAVAAASLPVIKQVEA
jgi:hypothetical protein